MLQRLFGRTDVETLIAALALPSAGPELAAGDAAMAAAAKVEQDRRAEHGAAQERLDRAANDPHRTRSTDEMAALRKAVTAGYADVIAARAASAAARAARQPLLDQYLHAARADLAAPIAAAVGAVRDRLAEIDAILESLDEMNAAGRARGVDLDHPALRTAGRVRTLAEKRVAAYVRGWA